MGEFKSPLNISKEKYSEIEEKLLKVRYIGRSLIIQLNSKSINENKVLDNLIVMFEDLNIYSKIELIFERLRCEKTTPFELFKNTVERWKTPT